MLNMWDSCPETEESKALRGLFLLAIHIRDAITRRDGTMAGFISKDSLKSALAEMVTRGDERWGSGGSGGGGRKQPVRND